MSNNDMNMAALFQRLITTTAGAVLGVIIIWMVSTLSDVSERLAVFEDKTYPPRYVTEMLKTHGEELRRCQIQIDRIESRIPGITNDHLEPYSLNTYKGNAQGG
jgi:hypothetical protein